jgi:hypothetical protein
VNPALWLLLRLQLGGWLRYLGRNVRTVRGALLALVGVAVFVPWLAAVLLGGAAGGGVNPEAMARYGPALLVLYCALNVLFSSHERAIYFTPAEVQFLFTGPFGRREVLSYKLLLTLLVSVPATVILSAVVRVRHGWAPAMLLGLLGVSIFMQLFSIALGLLANALGEQLYGRGRKVAIAALVILGAVIVLQAGGVGTGRGWRDLGEQVFDAPAYRVVSWPLRSFFDVMLADRLWPDLVAPLAVSLAVLTALLGVVFLLDAHYLEAAAAASARTYAKLQRMRGRAVTVEEATTPSAARWGLPMFPYLGGAGPVFWRQLTSALRGLGRLAWVLLIVGAAVTVPLLGGNAGQGEALFPLLVFAAAWVTVFLTTLVPFDFRGDIDRMATLKTLPVKPWRLALGQLLTPALILTLIQWLILAGALVVTPAESAIAVGPEEAPIESSAAGERAWILLAAACYAPAFSFLVVAVENLLFLLFPVRVMAATPGDFQALGRNVLLAMGKLVALVAVAGAAAVAIVTVYAVTHRIDLAVAAGWPVVALAGALLVPLIGLAFTWFDVGRDTPA